MPNAAPDVAEASAVVEADVAEASAVAEAVLNQAFAYVDKRTQGLALSKTVVGHNRFIDTVFAQHVTVQLARLRHTWSREGADKTVAALEGMGNGLGSLGAAAGKHSLHVKMVES